MATFSCKVTDNSKQALDELESSVAKALEMIGLQAERYAKAKCPTSPGGGRLKNSISHTVKDHTAYIGTDVRYGIYVEMGTGKYFPGGRQGGWYYKDEDGKWHHTYGTKAHHFLKKAATEHSSEYKAIAKQCLQD